jgi:hypothetical protein
VTQTIKAKRRCCRSGPRCKRCPVVLKRLEQAGFLEREGRRTWAVERKIPKKALKAARG